MRAERDIGFGPSGGPHSAKSRPEAPKAKSRAPFMKAKAPASRRGEREGETLLRRRRMHQLRRAARVAVLLVLVVGGYAGYRAGFADAALDKAQHGFATAMVDLGFVVNRIEVSGLQHIREEDLLTALDLDVGDPIFAFDMAGARSRIADLGWVRHVSVARQLPDGVAIEVTERRPFALWQIQGRFQLIDREGAVITDEGLEAFAALPVVVGAGAESSVGPLVDLVAAEPALAREMRAAVRVGQRRWDIVFRNGMRARLPEEGEAAAWHRLARLVARHDLLARAVHVVDLRLDDRLVLRLTPEAAEAAEADHLQKTLIGQGGAV